MPTDEPINGKPAPLGCFEIETMAPEYAEGLLTKRDRLRVEEHLGRCAACATAMEEMRAALSLLREVEGVEVPRGLVTRILKETTGNLSWKQKLRLWIRPMLEPRLALGLAMAVISFSIVLRTSGVDVSRVTLADLTPSRIYWHMDRWAHLKASNAVKYYRDLRVVYEIQTQLEAIRATTPPPEPAKPPQPQPRQQNQQPPAQNKWPAHATYLAELVLAPAANPGVAFSLR